MPPQQTRQVASADPVASATPSSSFAVQFSRRIIVIGPALCVGVRMMGFKGGLETIATFFGKTPQFFANACEQPT
jgi:hypothetical protein